MSHSRSYWNSRCSVAVLICLGLTHARAANDPIESVRSLATSACTVTGSGAVFDKERLRVASQARYVSSEYWRGNAGTSWYTLANGTRLKTFRFKGERTANVIALEMFRNDLGVPAGIANSGVLLDQHCRIIDERVTEFDLTGVPTKFSDSLGKSKALGHILNPAPVRRTPRKGVVIALIDSGVNYLLQDIDTSLARDDLGEIVGYDFLDNDNRPFDEDYILGGLWFPLRHGTSVASILIKLQPKVLIAPYRHPATQPQRYKELVEHLSRNGIRLANISIGGSNREEWEEFRKAAETHPSILFIISAGNEGKDLDMESRYPATFGLKNAIVVSALDKNGKLLPQSNFGRQKVDLAVVADELDGFQFDGRLGLFSGTSFAAPVVAALAAAILMDQPDVSTTDLKQRILNMAKSSGDQAFTKYGIINLH